MRTRVPSVAPAGIFTSIRFGRSDGARALAGVADRARDLAAAAAGRAGLLALQLQRARRPVVGLFQRDLGRVLDVLAAHRARCRAAAAEDPAQHVAEVERRRRLRAAAALAPQQVVDVERERLASSRGPPLPCCARAFSNASACSQFSP